ncbi:MAG: PqqD family protein [Lentisphaeria bacterium]
MAASDIFRINTPSVVHETIEGETVLLNLDSGNYYSLTETGAVALDLLAAGVPAGELAAKLGERYDGPAEAIAQAAAAFVAELQAEGLVVPGPAAGASPEVPAAGPARLPFAPPVLNKYSDMQELLLLDPIHEVDAAGWPASKPL